jgi:hypothetical protein
VGRKNGGSGMNRLQCYTVNIPLNYEDIYGFAHLERIERGVDVPTWGQTFKLKYEEDVNE